MKKIENLLIYESKAKATSTAEVKSQKKSLDSSLLLSLKSYKKDANTDLEEPIYRTIYISYKDKKINSKVQQLNYIILPRQNGFWSISSKRQNKNNIWDFVSSQPIDKPSVNNWSDKEIPYQNSCKIINFVGNDYVSFDVYSEGENQGLSWKNSKLQVISVNSLFFNSPIKLTEILTTSGLKIFKDSVNNIKNSLKNKNLSFEEVGDDNWGVERYNGHWILKSRIGKKTELDKDYSYEDFNIPLAAPEELIGYDDLYPSWGSIKESIPEAIDAFSSPQKDIIAIVTNTKIKIFKINKDIIDKNPLLEINLRKGESVIMDQWATGSYVDNWQKVFDSNFPEDIN